MKILKSVIAGAGALMPLVLCSGSASAAILAADDFNRADGNTLGATPVGGYNWVETGEHPAVGPGEIAIAGNQTTFLSRGHGDPPAATLSGLSLQNFDMSMTFSPIAQPDDRTNYLGGFMYRVPSNTHNFVDFTTGWTLYIAVDRWSSNQPAGSIDLAWGGGGSQVVYERPGGFTAGNTYTLRLVANETNHKVYLDGNLIIDYTDPDPARNISGVLGIGTYYGDYNYDNFSVSDLIPEPACLGAMALCAPLMRRHQRQCRM